MANIHIHRDHQLGLQGARAVAEQWAIKAQTQLDMVCAFQQGKASDEIQFSRPGVKGSLRVCKDHFELNAQLGMLLSAFKDHIVSEIARHLDDLLAQKSAVPAKKKKAT